MSDTLRKQKAVDTDSKTVSLRQSDISNRKLSTGKHTPITDVKTSPTRVPIKKPFQSRGLSHESLCAPRGKILNEKNVPLETGPCLILNPLHKRSRSEKCLLYTDPIKKLTSSEELQRDSGFHDITMSSQTAKSTQKKNASSLDNIPQSVSSEGTDRSYPSNGIPSLAVYKIKTDNYDDTEEVFTNCGQFSVNASTLKSYNSMEFLTNDELNTIESNLRLDDNFSSLIDIPSSPPPIPRRSSSYLNNCSMSDDLLLNQGKRLSQVLNINKILKSEEKSPLKFLLEKFGTIISRKKKSVPLMTPSPVHQPYLTPPICTICKPSGGPSLIYPNSSWLSPSPVSIQCPLPCGESRKICEESPTTKMKYCSPDPSLFGPLFASASQSSMQDTHSKSCNDIPSQKSMLETERSNSLEQLKKTKWLSGGEETVPEPPARSPTPIYLQLISDSISTSSTYENIGTEDQKSVSFYLASSPPANETNGVKMGNEISNHITHRANEIIINDKSTLKNEQTSLTANNERTLEVGRKEKTTSSLGRPTNEKREVHVKSNPPPVSQPKTKSITVTTSVPLLPLPTHIPTSSTVGETYDDSESKFKRGHRHTVDSRPLRSSAYKESITDWLRGRDIITDVNEPGNLLRTKQWKSLSDLLGSNNNNTADTTLQEASQVSIDEYYDMDNWNSDAVSQIEELYDHLFLNPVLDSSTEANNSHEDDSCGDGYVIMTSSPIQALCLETNRTMPNVSKRWLPLPPKSEVKGQSKKICGPGSVTKVQKLQKQFSRASGSHISKPPTSKLFPMSISDGPTLSFGQSISSVPAASSSNFQDAQNTRKMRTRFGSDSQLLSTSSPVLHKHKSLANPPPPPPTSTIPSREKKDNIPPPLPSIDTIPKHKKKNNDARFPFPSRKTIGKINASSSTVQDSNNKCLRKKATLPSANLTAAASSKQQQSSNVISKELPPTPIPSLPAASKPSTFFPPLPNKLTESSADKKMPLLPSYLPPSSSLQSNCSQSESSPLSASKQPLERRTSISPKVPPWPPIVSSGGPVLDTHKQIARVSLPLSNVAPPLPLLSSTDPPLALSKFSPPLLDKPKSHTKTTKVQILPPSTSYPPSGHPPPPPACGPPPPHPPPPPPPACGPPPPFGPCSPPPYGPLPPPVSSKPKQLGTSGKVPIPPPGIPSPPPPPSCAPPLPVSKQLSMTTNVPTQSPSVPPPPPPPPCGPPPPHFASKFRSSSSQVIVGRPVPNKQPAKPTQKLNSSGDNFSAELMAKLKSRSQNV